MNKTYDVVIIGGGPAGLTASYFLAKAGRSVCVLEQKKEIGRPICCAEAISAKSLESSGVFNESYIDSKVKGFRIFFPNNKFFFVESPGYLLNKDKFEQFLAQQASQCGADIILSKKAINMYNNNGILQVETASDKINADFIIGADGPGSLTERAFFNNTFNSLDAVQYRISKDSFPYSCDGFLDSYYDALSPYYFWVFEKHKEINIGGGIADKKILDEFIKKHFPLVKLTHATFSHGKVPASWIKKCIYNNKVFLTGDAAGLTNPVTFAGIYSAITSGKICAETIINYYDTREPKTLQSYASKIRKEIYSDDVIRRIAVHSFKFPEYILNFIGEYFNGRSYRTKDFIRFFSLSFKIPAIYSHLFPLISHRNLLRYHKNDIW